jgi:hypothetical protein
MPNLHIVGIGGTGHKVLTSIIHLAACGGFDGVLGPNGTIRVLTIDADNANGNLSHTKLVLKAYQNFTKAINGEAFGIVNIESVTPDVNLSLYDSNRNSISNTFNIAQYDNSDEEKLIKFLYTDAEIKTKFNQGFYGHTSIGTLVISSFLEGNEIWDSFHTQINENDFVVVIGSIFGGTGASAIPVIIRELNKKRERTPFYLASLMLTPYFNTIGLVKQEGLLMPDSDNFHIKAKAALYFYNAEQQYNDIDALYIIGEPKTNFSNEAYNRGSSKQCNSTHPIEMFAATAIFDFIDQARGRKGNKDKIITAEREEDNRGSYYTWNMLRRANQNLPANMRQFLKIAILYTKILYSQIKANAGGKWLEFYPGINSKTDENGNLMYENVSRYFRYFIDWVFDLHNTKEIDQAGKMKLRVNDNVRLFKVNNAEPFNGVPVTNPNIPGFDELVYNMKSKSQSEKFYNEISSQNRSPDSNYRDFKALFDTSIKIIKDLEKGGGILDLFKKNQNSQENIPSEAYLSKENGVPFNNPNADPNKLWAACDPEHLLDIADGLPNTSGESFSRDDVSIPSPWSIFIMNELTLRESKFNISNKRDAYFQWCGIIALLALRSICLYENHGLKLRRLNFTADDKFDNKFMDSVRKSRSPNSIIFDDQVWTNCYIVTLDTPDHGDPAKTIAFLANNTILCPAYSFDKFTKDMLHKIAPSIVDYNGDFRSPEHYFRDQSVKTNRQAKYGLQLFLGELLKIITRIAAENEKPIIADLQEKIRSFLGDLGERDEADGIFIPPYEPDKIVNVFTVFDKLSPKSRFRPELPFVLADTISDKSVALLGLNICNIPSNGEEAPLIHVTDTLLYNQITTQEIQKRKGQIYESILLVDEAELLNDTLILIAKNNEDVFQTLSGKGSDDEYQIVWPISEKLLDLYKVDTLNNMLAFTKNNNNTITITLTLKTRGKFGDHVISKEYPIVAAENSEAIATRAAIIVNKNRMPFWAVWPYSKILDPGRNNIWKLYSFFCIDPKYSGIAVFEIDPYCFSSPDWKKLGEKKLLTICTSNNDVFYRRYNDLPAVFKIKEKKGDTSIYRGTVFLSKPKEFNLGHADWNIGVDFGTTSTTAYYTINNDDTPPDFIQLLKEYKWVEGSEEPEFSKQESDMSILCNSGEKSDLNYLDCYFIDKQCLGQKSYTTTYEVMENSNGGENAIFDIGRIFWHNYENFKSVNTIQGRYNQLHTNIKWEKERTFAEKYLSQLMTQIVYHAATREARNINLFFSYPTAFGLNNKGEFQNTLISIRDALKRNTGIDIRFVPEDNLLTESIAAAYYFKNQNPNKQVFLCVDIGGGTSDISIWIRTKYVFQSSIRFASRDMFVEPLKKLLERKSVMEVVRTTNNSDGIYTMLSRVGTNNQIADDKIKFLIETVLFEYYDKFKNRLSKLTGEDEEAYLNFKRYVMVAYSGLVYYIANIIAELLVTDNSIKRIPDDIVQIVFGLSGKGSKLTDWIEVYCPFIYEEAQKLIQENTKTFANQEGRSIQLLKQHAGKNAKTETAYGLICKVERQNQNEIIKADVYMGCDITVKRGNKEEKYEKNKFVDVYTDNFARPDELIVEMDKNLPELEKFIEFFNRIATRTQNDIPSISKDWYSDNKKILWNDISEMMLNTLKEKRFEAPFVLMLNVFLKEYFAQFNK